MARRGAALWLAVLLAAALATSAGQASVLPAVADDHEAIAVDVPLGPDGSGSLQVPVAGGILDLQVDPVLLSGPGGTVDVQAYVARAMMLLPDGVSLPLPSMVILPESQAIEGPAGQTLADLAAEVERLRSALADLQGTDPQDDAPQDPILVQVQALQDQVGALVAESQWMQAFADEAAAAAGAGVADQVAIASAMLGRVEAGVALVRAGLDRLAQQANEVVPMPAVSVTASASPSPSPSPSVSPSVAPTASATPSASPAPGPDTGEAMQPFLDAIAEAQARADEAMAGAEQARDALEGMAGGTVGFVDDRVDEQAILDGANWALAKAQEDLGEAQAGAAQGVADTQEGADARLTELRMALEERGQATSDWGVAQAEAAATSVEELAADLEWAADWVAEVEASAPPLAQQSLEDAARSVAAAQATVQALRELLYEYSPPEGQAAADAFGQRLATAQAMLPPQVQAARQDTEAALSGMPALVGGLQLSPDTDVDDSDGLAVCVGAVAARTCMIYHSPAESTPLGMLTLLVALPIGSAGLDLPGSATSLTSSMTLTQLPVPLPPLPSGLPGGSGPGSGSPSPSSSMSHSASASSSSSSSSGGGSSLASSSTSASATSSAAQPAAQGQPHLAITAEPDALSLRMGTQGSLLVTVRNDGDAADRVRLTAQTDAPITADATTGSLDLAPGTEGRFTVRLTPLRAGSGTLDLLATGDAAGTVRDGVAIAVAPAPAAAAAIAARLEPSALEGAVGQAMQVTINLANNGPVADRVVVQVSGAGVKAEPSRIEVLLQPAETAIREVQVTPTEAGAHQVQMGISSERGADLHPLLLLHAEGSMTPAASEPVGDDVNEKPKKQGTPAIGIVSTGAAIAVAFLAIRRRLEK